jgi:hypothetical protein
MEFGELPRVVLPFKYQDQTASILRFVLALFWRQPPLAMRGNSPNTMTDKFEKIRKVFGDLGVIGTGENEYLTEDDLIFLCETFLENFLLLTNLINDFEGLVIDIFSSSGEKIREKNLKIKN